MELHELPYDILLDIFSRLDSKDLLILSQVNKALNILTNDDLLWKIKLTNDLHKWKMIDSKTWPENLILNSKGFEFNSNKDEPVDFKKIYLNLNPELVTKKEILKNLKSFQHKQQTLNATSTSDYQDNSSTTNNTTLSSFAMPMLFYNQFKDYLYRNVFTKTSNDEVPKIVMFGPGLETSTSCLVTNILWKSEFKTTGMIPGIDGFGSGIKLKLFNHKPFNLTILYTNVSSVRNSNNHELNANHLLKSSDDNSYELNPQVKEACSNANGFIYVIDNNNNNLTSNDNYRTELNILMKESNKNLPVLILSLKSDSINEVAISNKKTELSCAQIVQFLELNKLNREWQIRNCQIFEQKMKGIVLGFEWLLNQLDQKL